MVESPIIFHRMQSGEDLSRFALPFIDSLDKVKGDPSMDDSTGRYRT